MANSTWLQATNRLLRNSGLPEIDSSDSFNSPSAGQMTRYQLCAREYIAIVHEMVSVDLPVNFARRAFQLNIDNIAGPIYNLSSDMSVESITYDSFRNLSPAPPGPGVLRNWTYEYFTKRYADVSFIESGAPTHYIFLPVAQTDISPIYKVRFFPNPDRAYTIEYIAQLNPYPLVNADSVILWTPEYEHALINTARFSLEEILGEGKAGSLYAVAQRAIQKVRQKATASKAEKKAVRMKKMFVRRGAFGYYDSPPDSDAPYGTPDSIR